MKGERIMKTERVFAVYFSPTSGTKSYVEAIAGKLKADYETIDLTKPEIRRGDYHFTSSDLVVLGAPVYAGRLPVVAHGIFSCLHGNDTPAVFTVSYGNREFEDALLEEKEVCEANGFVGIGAASWIAPHSFSSKIAANRPDDDDERRVGDFVTRLKEVLKKDIPLEAALQVPGDHPYRDLKSVPIHPEGDSDCTYCNTCVQVCPVEAIPLQDPKKTDGEICISCLACVKNCPVGSRRVSNPMYAAIVEKLEAGLMKVRKEPEFFF